MNIGIIGAGNIGGSLGKVWAAQGHDICFGARDPNSPKTRQALTEIGAARIAPPAEAAAFGDVVVIAVPGNTLHESIPALGDLSGKVVIDTTNRFGPVPSQTAQSNAEYIAELAPGARVVKAFNTMWWQSILNPLYGGVPVTAFLCGDDADAKNTVGKLTAAIGIHTEDVGGLAEAANVEVIAWVWMAIARNSQNPNFALTAIRR